MSYEKHTWETGETITAEKLNNLEDGVASGGGDGGNFVVTFTQNEGTVTADKTFAQIKSAYESGQNIVGKFQVHGGAIEFILTINYVVISDNEISTFAFACVSAESEGGTLMGITNYLFGIMVDNSVADATSSVLFGN